MNEHKGWINELGYQQLCTLKCVLGYAVDRPTVNAVRGEVNAAISRYEFAADGTEQDLRTITG